MNKLTHKLFIESVFSWLFISTIYWCFTKLKILKKLGCCMKVNYFCFTKWKIPKKLGCFVKVKYLLVLNKLDQLSLFFRFFMNQDLYSSLNKMLARFVMTYKKNYPSKLCLLYCYLFSLSFSHLFFLHLSYLSSLMAFYKFNYNIIFLFSIFHIRNSLVNLTT